MYNQIEMAHNSVFRKVFTTSLTHEECTKVWKILPSEKESEYAARWPTKYRYNYWTNFGIVGGQAVKEFRWRKKPVGSYSSFVRATTTYPLIIEDLMAVFYLDLVQVIFIGFGALKGNGMQNFGRFYAFFVDHFINLLMCMHNATLSCFSLLQRCN